MVGVGPVRLSHVALMHAAGIADGHQPVGAQCCQAVQEAARQILGPLLDGTHLGFDVRVVHHLVRQLDMDIGEIFLLQFLERHLRMRDADRPSGRRSTASRPAQDAEPPMNIA